MTEEKLAEKRKAKEFRRRNIRDSKARSGRPTPEARRLQGERDKKLSDKLGG